MSEDNVVDLEKYRKKSVKFGFCGFNKHLEQEIKDKKEQVKHYLNTLPLDRKMEMAFRGLCELYDSIFYSNSYLLFFLYNLTLIH